ncbi:MAG: hypothetical protein FJ123_21225 [Deltaproteobacteria bacterium]|nr:hypothetical protein [Deltaproteobacteria bacterium]
MNNPLKKEILVVFFCLLIGFALRFYTFDQKSLWLDEIYTFNDAKYGLEDQIKYYKEKPYNIQAPLFFVLTHLFYPFTKPERDLRIIPLVFGTLSIPMIYLLARLFSPMIALPCSLSLAFMAYHISLSQDGRSYVLLMFLGIAGLYFFMKHLQTLKRRFLIPAALSFALLFHTSYSSIPFIVLSQLLWFYRLDGNTKKPTFSSFLIFNGLLLFFCLPWILFIVTNYKGQLIIGYRYRSAPDPLWNIFYGILHDWVPHIPLMIASVALLILFPVFSKFRKNALVLISTFVLPVGGVYIYCKLFHITHFITSRYFINLLPMFFITLYLALNATEDKLKRLNKFMRLRFIFIILFIASNLVILPLYYRSEKQDVRGLTNYLKTQLHDGDKIIVGTELYIPSMLFYFGIYPEGRLYLLPSRKVSEEETEYIVPLIIQNNKIIISHSKTYWHNYITDRGRLWIVLNKTMAKDISKNPLFILKGYFDGSFLNFNRFPTDASIYLFLWDPKSPGEKGIDMPIE